MSLTGNLEDLALSDIIQIIHLSRKTGTLALNSKTGNGMIIFKEGHIIQASSPIGQQLTTDILLAEDLISHQQIEQAISLQQTQYQQLAMSSILIKLDYISRSVLEDVLKEQIRQDVFHLLQWTEGYFNFEMDNIQPDEIIGPSSDKVVLREGITPQSIFIEAARQEDKKAGTLVDEDTEPLPPSVVEAAEDTIPPEKGLSEPLVSEPREEEQQVKPPVIPPPPENKTTSLVGASKPQDMSVLIVDDERVFLDLVSKNLTHQGFSVFGFTDADEAFQELISMNEQNINPILVSDIILPSSGSEELGGIEFLDKVSQTYPNIPVIILSDQQDPQIRYQAYEHGARNYLYKPDRSALKISEITKEINRFGEEIGLCIKNILRERRRLGDMMVSVTAIKEATKTSPPTEKKEAKSTRELVKMKQIFYELQNPKETSEVILLVLRLASEHLERGILFLIKDEVLQGIGGFGNAMDGEQIISKMHLFNLSLSGESFFHNILETKKMFCDAPPSTPTNDDLFQMIGRSFSQKVVAIPLISEGRVVAIFYGDNGSRMKEIENILGLEIFINQAGIALENALMQKKLKGKLL
ncbi:DUF4388 domain-containing protein [candidate division CSSED10-310 bacterium]|uniref:DUF4388 domain-containing protein n=1 Tax=candidate division CSSED10-310 bacterium TaxID=2855610 RepID=A0ABV6YRX8_UNCC1